MLDGQTVLFRRATNTTLQGDLYAVQPGGPVDPTTGVPARTRVTATDSPTTQRTALRDVARHDK